MVAVLAAHLVHGHGPGVMAGLAAGRGRLAQHLSTVRLGPVAGRVRVGRVMGAQPRPVTMLREKNASPRNKITPPPQTFGLCGWKSCNLKGVAKEGSGMRCKPCLRKLPIA